MARKICFTFLLFPTLLSCLYTVRVFPALPLFHFKSTLIPIKFLRSQLSHFHELLLWILTKEKEFIFKKRFSGNSWFFLVSNIKLIFHQNFFLDKSKREKIKKKAKRQVFPQRTRKIVFSCLIFQRKMFPSSCEHSLRRWSSRHI